MDGEFTETDLDVILDSLKHYKTNIENRGDYPSYEFKQEQLKRVESAMKKINALRRDFLAVIAI